jgi:RNA polymerase sigma-70 factor (family 1)
MKVVCIVFLGDSQIVFCFYTPPPMTPEHENILSRLKAGDLQAYRMLFDKYYVNLCKQAALKIGGDIAIAEDIVQQVFIDFWAKERYKSIDQSLSAYLSKMVLYQSVNYIRSDQSRRHHHEAYQVLEEQLSDGDMDLEARERLEKQLHAIIEQLPDQRREIFVNVYFKGKKYQTVADELGISINTVKGQLRRVMLELKDKLDTGLFLLLLLSPVIRYLND